jgi:hypothetical protein
MARKKEEPIMASSQVQSALKAASAALEIAGKADPRIAAGIAVLEVLRNLDEDEDLEIPLVSALVERLREKRKKEPK